MLGNLIYRVTAAFECMWFTDKGLWGGKVFWENFFLQGRNWGKGLLLGWCFFCYYLLLFVHSPMQMTFMFPTIFLNSPAIFFAVVNILRIWEDFKCLCLSGLFLQKQLRTVFWQQEAYKNLEKKKKKNKIKHLTANSYERNASLLPYLKPAKQSGIAARKDHLSAGNQHQFVQSGCSLGHLCAAQEEAGDAFVGCDSPVTPGRCRVCSGEIGLFGNWKLLVALFCLLNFNNKENRGSL